MSLSGSRGLVRISQNPNCTLQAAMVSDRVKEPDFYRQVTGREFPGEYGERLPARRRGAKFEANANQNYAAQLRSRLGELMGVAPDDMVVRNLEDEVPGARNGIRAQRLHRTRNILRDLKAGRPVPDIVIQPQFRLWTGPGRSDHDYISPDFIVLNKGWGMYLPGELKSFIVRDGEADPGDLDRTRRQAAVEILALRQEAAVVGIASEVQNRAGFVFATPYGLRPASAFIEPLDAEVREVERAVGILRDARVQLARIRLRDHEPLAMLVDDLPIEFRESCFSNCILADYCRDRADGSMRVLGDSAADQFGPEFRLERLWELMDGAPAVNDDEFAIVDMIRMAEDASGQSFSTLGKAVA